MNQEAQPAPRLSQAELVALWAILLRIGTVESVVQVGAISLEDALEVFQVLPRVIRELHILKMELDTARLVQAAERQQAVLTVIAERASLIQRN